MAQAGPSRLGGSGGGGGSRGAGEAPGGGPAPLIRLRSKAPLPLFTCPHPIPSASSTIGDSLKLSVLRLLTGEVNERSSTAPMTESELLKLRTIHGWRMEMIALELRQNVLIAPETRDKIGEGVEDEMEGFELVDDADCGLLEADDEVLIRLKPAFSLSDLHLPKLSSNHHYALPPGALTRAGTLSSPPPYSQVNVKRAAEPSSHSSSVQGQPNANFHARQWRDYSRGPRAVIAGAVTAPTAAETKEAKKARATSNPALNGPSRPLGLGMGVEPPAAVPSAMTYKAPPLKQRRSKTNTAEQGPSSQAPQSSMVPLISPPASAASAAPPPLPPAPQRKPSESKSRPVTGGSGQDKVASVSSPPPSATASNFGLASATTPTTATTANTATSSSAAGQESMPLTALVIGPGVQGAVGRGTSSAAMGHSGPAQVNGSTSVPDDYGNAKAFASFTAAGGEVQHRAKPRRQSSSHSQSTAAQRKMSQHSRTRSQEVAGVADDGEAGEPARAAVEAAQRRAAAARAAATAMSFTGGEPTPLSTSPEPSTAVAQRLNGDHSEAAAAAPPAPVSKTRPSGKERKSSSKRERVELPEPPVLPPITNLAPFPEDQPQQQRETLPPMPTPADVGKGVPALRRKQSSKSGEDGNGLAAPARRPTLDGRVSSTTSGAVRTGESTPTTSRSNSPVVTRRPSYNVRQASTGAESNGSAGGTASRLARLAAPGLGLGGFGRKKSSTKGSATPKTAATDDAAPAAGEGDVDGLAGDSEPTTPAEQPVSNSNGALATTPDEPTSTPPATSTSTSTSSAPLSRAERRYLDFQKSQQAEMSRQHAAERDRLAAMEKERREKAERAKKREEEERQRKHKEKDEVWQEVRRRAAAEKEKERERATAAVGMTRKHSSGMVAAVTAGAGGGTDGGHDGGGHGGGGHDGGGGGS